MSQPTPSGSSRRQFLQNTGRITAATALAGIAAPHVHAAEDNTLKVVLIGCGGRGTGAAANALASQEGANQKGPIKLVAMADIFQNRLDGSLRNLQTKYADQVDVPKERQFIGFDGYQKAMDCLSPGDIAIFTTPLAFRWVHFTYAIQKGLNVFMEKPLTADGPTSRRMLKLGEEASAKNLKVGVGLMSRHSRPLQQLHQRVTDGAIGDIISMRAYRMTGPIGSAFSQKWPGQPSELLWQLQRFHSFLWASGGCYNDFYIHVIDHCCWMKNAWPLKAQAVGGRHYRQDCVDQNFDSYGVEYIFDDGTRLHLDGRCISGAENIYSSYLHGSKGSATASNHGDCGPPSKIFTGQVPDNAAMTWESTTPPGQGSPHQTEWYDLIDAIRTDQPYNEVEYGVMASLTSSLGRKAAHTGRELTLEGLLNSDHEYAPDVDKMTMDSPPPLKSDEEGRYPIPMPGLVTKREY